MGVIFRPSQGLQHLQLQTTHRHTRKIWRIPKTMLRNQMQVQQKHSQDHHRQGWDIHQLQSGCQTRRHHDPGTISVLNYGLRRNTIRRVDVPGTKQSQICMKGKLTKINRTISEPTTRQILVWNSIWYILHALFRQWNIFFESRTDIEIGINLLSNHFARFGLEMHIGTEKKPQILNAYFSHHQVSLTQ